MTSANARTIVRYLITYLATSFLINYLFVQIGQQMAVMAVQFTGLLIDSFLSSLFFGSIGTQRVEYDIMNAWKYIVPAGLVFMLLFIYSINNLQGVYLNASYAILFPLLYASFIVYKLRETNYLELVQKHKEHTE